MYLVNVKTVSDSYATQAKRVKIPKTGLKEEVTPQSDTSGMLSQPK